MANQSNYWDRRTLELQNSIALHEQALFQNLRQYYNKEAAELDRDIAAYYSKYGTNNVIQYRNLLQSLSDADKQLLYEKIQDFEKQYPQYAHLMPVRESIYKLDRLEGLRTSVAIQQLKMGAYEIAQAQAHFQQMALLAGNLIAEQMGYGSSFYRIDSDMVRLVVGQDWCNNQDFSARIWNNRNTLTQTLQTQIVNGMIRGDSYKAISKSVQNKFQTVSQRNIERLVFTEDTFLANEAAMQTYLNDPDYTYYEYVALCDGKTCDLCASLTGERFRISERRPGTNFPPLHPWCRCFFDIVHEKNSGKYTERNSENPRNRRQTGLTTSKKNVIINLYDSNSIYHEITEENIQKVPKLKVFQDEKLNIAYQRASQDLLRVAKRFPKGKEISAIYNKNMEPIEGFNHYVIGKIGSVKVKNPGILFHAFHNHGSGGTFSFTDLIHFSECSNMLSFAAVGNNGNLYHISRTENSDDDGYHFFLLQKSKEVIYINNNIEFTLGAISDSEKCEKLKKVVSNFSDTEREELRKAIENKSLECIKGGEKYGFQYKFAKT